VPVPAGVAAAFEVVQAEAVFELAVVVLDAPADLGQAYQVAQAGAGRQVGEPVVSGLGLAGWPFGDQPAFGQVPSGARGMSRLAGLTRSAVKRDRIAAVRLPGAFFEPCRQVTRRQAFRPA
jgi:hypothetical protein